jgi:hypothetical protein
MKKYTLKSTIKLTVLFYVLAVCGIVFVINACNKSKHSAPTGNTELQVSEQPVAQPLQQNAPQTKVVTVMDLSVQSGGSVNVIFRELEEAFTASDPAVVAALKKAFEQQSVISITFDPWQALVKGATVNPGITRAASSQAQATYTSGASHSVNLSIANDVDLNNPEALGILNTTTAGLVSVIPDWATAQLMFDYIAHQCCALPGPYGVDHCISFQYCEDGCYARAHKMCWVLNNVYHYATHKVFSFAYPSSYTLSVKAEKWGGCCINWWYHVAPLVNIKTPTGIKAFVFDPAMFDQPVTLATWLHAQENPACASGRTPKVTSFNIQPTASYSPMDTAHFGTDPAYTNTNSTLIGYAPLKTCP